MDDVFVCWIVIGRVVWIIWRIVWIVWSFFGFIGIVGRVIVIYYCCYCCYFYEYVGGYVVIGDWCFDLGYLYVIDDIVGCGIVF